MILCNGHRNKTSNSKRQRLRARNASRCASHPNKRPNGGRPLSRKWPAKRKTSPTFARSSRPPNSRASLVTCDGRSSCRDGRSMIWLRRPAPMAAAFRLSCRQCGVAVEGIKRTDRRARATIDARDSAVKRLAWYTAASSFLPHALIPCVSIMNAVSRLISSSLKSCNLKPAATRVVGRSE